MCPASTSDTPTPEETPQLPSLACGDPPPTLTSHATLSKGLLSTQSSSSLGSAAWVTYKVSFPNLPHPAPPRFHTLA